MMGPRALAGRTGLAKPSPDLIEVSGEVFAEQPVRLACGDEIRQEEDFCYTTRGDVTESRDHIPCDRGSELTGSQSGPSEPGPFARYAPEPTVGSRQLPDSREGDDQHGHDAHRRPQQSAG